MNLHISRYLLALVALAAVFSSACVWGVVKDIEKGAPIDGATVTYHDAYGGTGTTTSGPNGFYSFDTAQGQPLPALDGTVTYSVTAPGYDLLTLDHLQTMSMPRTLRQFIPFSLTTVGNNPLPGCRGIIIRWVYQANGSTDLTHHVLTGTSCMDGWGSPGIRFDPKADPNAGTDLSFSCRAMYHGYFPWGPAFWLNNEVSGVHDMGLVSFDELTSVPDKSQGAGDHKYYNSQGVRAITNHVYAVVTRDGEHYAKLMIDASTCGAQ